MKRRDSIRNLLVATAIPVIGLNKSLARAELLGTDLLQNKRKIYLFSKVLQFLPLSELPGEVKKLGFDGIDVTVRKGGHVDPSEVKNLLPELVNKCREIGLETPVMTTTILEGHSSETRDILETASSVGIKHYRMGWYTYDFSRDLKAQLASHQENVRQLNELNKQLGICGNYQNHAGNSLGAAVWDAHELTVLLPSESTGLEYDIRHAMVEGAFSWPVTFELVKDKINMVDIKDFNWECNDRKLNPVNVPLGKGAVDFSSFFKLLNENNIYTPLSLHVEHDLGGAEKGDRVPKISKEAIYQAVRNDLIFLKNVA